MSASNGSGPRRRVYGEAIACNACRDFLAVNCNVCRCFDTEFHSTVLTRQHSDFYAINTDHNALVLSSGQHKHPNSSAIKDVPLIQ
jgi:hypothetical protein